MARADLVARRRTLGQLLAGAGLALRADLLRAWARWITPEDQPRRYDTAFFVALLPVGQEADAHTTEAVEATWWYPGEALEQRERGEIRLMAPTLRTLREIAEQPDSAAVLAAADRRQIRPITPRLVHRDGRRRVVLLGRSERRHHRRRARPAGPGMSHPAYGELRPVTSLASVLLAENPSPMTLEGTNSWVLRAPGHRGVRRRRPGRVGRAAPGPAGRLRSGRADPAHPPPPRPRRRGARGSPS